ncbi:hypothetical protein TGCAST_287430, partial [Toxoplasma gondii CAST]
TAQLWHARKSSDLAAETQTQASGVSSSTEPAEASDMAGQSSPRGTIQVPRDLVERQSEPALEKPLDEAVASPFVDQIPFWSPTPVTTTEGAWRESAAVASTTHAMASGDLTTSSDWLTHAERTSESASSLILHYQTAPLFAPGAPQAVVYGGPCTSGDSGGPPYSLSPTVEHAGAAHTTGDPRTESDIPEDVVEFVLSYSSPAVMASGDGAALFAESAPSFIQPGAQSIRRHRSSPRASRRQRVLHWSSRLRVPRTKAQHYLQSQLVAARFRGQGGARHNCNHPGVGIACTQIRIRTV